MPKTESNLAKRVRQAGGISVIVWCGAVWCQWRCDCFILNQWQWVLIVSNVLNLETIFIISSTWQS